MARQGHPAAERLRAYLRQLKPGARALLISELERGLLHDTSPAGAEMVLAELRRSLREGSVRITRFDDNARLFFHPLEPFLVDDGPDHRHRGRIARTTLEPIWLWINNTLMPEDARAYALLVDAAMLAGDSERAEHAAHEFHDRVAPRIRQLLETATDRDRGRLSVQLGTVRAVDDVKTVCEILSGRDSLASIGMQLPGHIDSFGGLILDIVQKQLDDTLGSRSDLLVYALVLVMERLAAPWQLIRLATKVAGGGDVKRMAETPYGAAIDIVIEEVDRRIRELAGDLKSGRGIAVSALLKEIHDALRGIRSEAVKSSTPLVLAIFPDRVMADPELQKRLNVSDQQIMTLRSLRKVIYESVPDIPVIELDPVLRQHPGVYRRDDTHLSDEGNKITGEYVAHQIAPLLKIRGSG